MTFKERLIQELDNVPDPMIGEVLDFLQFLKSKEREEQEDLQEARFALANISTEGTVAWRDLKSEIGR